MARSTLAPLIGRVRVLLAGDTIFTDDALQSLLDAHARPFRVRLVPDLPAFTTHRSVYMNIESVALLYAYDDTLLTVDVDYTIDLERGLVTTTARDERWLWLHGVAHDPYAAAADGWLEIAQRSVGFYDATTAAASLKRSQLYDHALMQSERMRARAMPVIL